MKSLNNELYYVRERFCGKEEQRQGQECHNPNKFDCMPRKEFREKKIRKSFEFQIDFIMQIIFTRVLYGQSQPVRIQAPVVATARRQNDVI